MTNLELDWTAFCVVHDLLLFHKFVFCAILLYIHTVR